MYLTRPFPKEFTLENTISKKMAQIKSKKLHKQLCPKCGGPIFPFVGFSAGMIYECKRCGYHGPLALNEAKPSKRRRI
jgi:ribosomal protein L37AE/L43A